MENDNTTEPQTTEPAQPDWREGIAEDIRQASDLSDVSGVSDLAVKYLALKRTAGADMFALPKTDEETAAVFKKLGTPESADGYELPAFGDVSEEDKGAVDEMDGVLKRAAFGANLTKAQLAKFRDAFYQESKTQFDAEKAKTDAEHAKVEQELRAEFGASFDSRIRDFVQICDSVGMTDALREMGAGFSKAVIKGVHRVESAADNRRRRGANRRPDGRPRVFRRDKSAPQACRRRGFRPASAQKRRNLTVFQTKGVNYEHANHNVLC